MPLTSVADWSQTPIDNIDIDGIPLAEGTTTVPDFNNLFRAAMAQLAGYALPGSIQGLTLSNSSGDPTNDIDIAAGSAMDSTGRWLMKLTSAMTKRLDAVWAAGTNAGGRLSGATVTDFTYHVYLMRDPTTGDEDIGFSGTNGDPTGGVNYPAAYTQYRRIASIIRSSGAIVGFIQNGDDFTLKVPQSLTISGVPKTATLGVLSGIPLGLSVRAKLNLRLTAGLAGETFRVLVTDPATTDTAPTSLLCHVLAAVPASGVFVTDTGYIEPQTDTSGRVRYRASELDSETTLSMIVNGWVDRRGKD